MVSFRVGEQGTLYPALLRLQQRGWIKADRGFHGQTSRRPELIELGFAIVRRTDPQKMPQRSVERGALLGSEKIHFATPSSRRRPSRSVAERPRKTSKAERHKILVMIQQSL